MLNLKNKLYSTQDVRYIDDLAINTYQQQDLMQRAGSAVFSHIKTLYPTTNNMVIFCGKGNNGGDGLVVAALAKQAGYNVTVYHTHPIDTWQGEAKDALQMAEHANVTLILYKNESQINDNTDIIVDALLGTGVKGYVSALYANIIDKINAYQAPVICVDIPSGLDADTGKILGHSVKADATVSFIAQKQGLFTGDAANLRGKLLFETLDILKEVYHSVKETAFMANFNDLAQKLPQRANAMHKGQAGHVLVIAGDEGFGGAGLMAALSAYRAGAGLVTLATHPKHASEVMAAHPEIMVKHIDDASTIDSLFDNIEALVIGPGLTSSSWSNAIMAKGLKHDIPKVVDAGALDYLKLTHLNLQQAILTPHPGEAGRLLSTSTDNIQKDRFSSIDSLYKAYESTIVLKGAGSLVTNGKRPLFVCNAGNAGMATGGMGDILAGIIGALLAEKVTLFDAACLGVQLHSEAADNALKTHSKRSLMATDLLVEIQKILAAFEKYTRHV